MSEIIISPNVLKLKHFRHFLVTVCVFGHVPVPVTAVVVNQWGLMRELLVMQLNTGVGPQYNVNYYHNDQASMKTVGHQEMLTSHFLKLTFHI